MLTRATIRDERGLTLAEILVATVILSIGLVGLAMVIPLSTYGVHEGNALSTATFLAEQRLEQIRGAAWTTTPSANDCLGLGPGTAPTSTNCTRTLPSVCDPGAGCTTFSDESTVSGYPTYTRSVRITDCGLASGCAGVVDSNMRLVRVAVTYRAMSGVGGPGAAAAKSAVLEMIVARRQ